MSAIFIGIDIGKKSHAYCILSSNLLKRYQRYQRCPHGSLKNERAGFEEILARARAEAGGRGTIHVLTEHTGHYGYNLEQYLQEQPGVLLYRAQARKRLGRDKTDKKDAQSLAVKLYSQVSLQTPITDEHERVRIVRDPSPTVVELRPLVSRRLEVLRDRIRTGNRLLGVVDQLIPELTHLYKDANCPSALVLRETYPTAQAIAEAPLPALIATRRRARRPGNAAFAQMQSLAKNSIGLKEGPRRHSLVIEQAQLIEQVHLCEQQQLALEERIKAVLAHSREALILQSIPGIGPMLSAQLLAGIGNIRNFESVVKFRSYTGWAPRRSQTGTTYDSSTTDRGGNRLCKQAIRLAAVSAIGLSPRWASLHKRLAAGPHAGGAMGRVCGQYVGVIYALLSRDAELIDRITQGGEVPDPVLYDDAHH